MIERKYYEEFDYLGDTAYLDVASVSLQPRRTLDYCRRYQDGFASKLGRWSFDGTNEAVRTETRRLVAQMLHASEDEILFTANTTQGNNLLVNALQMSPGDAVITTDYEYPSVSLGWAQKQSEGVVLKLVPTHNGTFDAKDVLSLIHI